MRDVGEFRSLKERPGGDVYVIGGAALVYSLMNEDLIDELRLIVHPVILGGGKALFAGVSGRRAARSPSQCDQGPRGHHTCSRHTERVGRR